MSYSDRLQRQTLSAATPVLLRNLCLLIFGGIVIFIAARHYSHLLRSANFTGHEGDYAIFAEFGRQLVKGGRIYVDYWDTKPPGLFFVLAPFVLVFGNTIFAIHLATVVLFLLFVAAVFALAFTLTQSRFAALLAAGLALLYTTYQRGPETTFVMTTFGTWAMFLAAAARGRVPWLFASGVLFAFGCLTKQPLVVELPALVLVAVWRAGAGRIRTVLAMLGGMAALGAVVFIWAVSLGILEAMIYRVVHISAQYVFTADGGWHFRADSASLFETYLMRQAWPYVRPLALVAGVAVAGLLFQARRRRGWLIVLLWLVTSIAGAAIARGLRADYFTQALPALLMLVALGAAAIRQYRVGWQTALLVVSLLAAYQFIPRYADPFQAIPLQMPQQDAVIELIHQHTDEADCIWTWGGMAYFNYLTGRDSCASAALEAFVMESTAFPVAETRVEYMQEMIAATPALLIDAESWGYFPELRKYADRYRRELVFENREYKVYAVDRSSWHPLPAPVNFGGEVALIGYDRFDAPATVCPGDTLRLALTWQQISRPTHEYQVFVQLLTPDEQAKVAGYDGVPVSKRPTYTWVNPGEVILGEPFTLAIPEALTAGTYPLIAGLYDVETLAPLAVAAPTGSAYARLDEIRIAADC